jgi:hypothetical protein
MSPASVARSASLSNCTPGLDLARLERRERRLGDDPARHAQALGGDVAVVVGRQVVGRDARRRRRIGRADADVAAAGRIEVAHARGEGIDAMQRLAERIERERLDVVLEVGCAARGCCA